MVAPVRPEEFSEEKLLDLIRAALPRLLREHSDLRYEVAGILAEAFPSRQEFGEMLAEVRALREDFRRFAEETARSRMTSSPSTARQPSPPASLAAR